MTRIRRTRPEEAGLLRELAFRSKAHWGYDDTFMAACRNDLTLMPGALAERPHYLLEYKDHIAEFYNLAETPDGVFLQNLFVAPEFIRRGVGGRLWAHMVEEAEAGGYKAVFIESDPYAEAFYLSRGAVHAGSAPSSAIPGRELPLLVFRPRPPETHLAPSGLV